MKKLLCLLLCFGLVILPLAGCNSETEETAEAVESGSITVIDSTGREVTIETPIETYAVSTMDVVDFVVPLKGEDALNMLVATGESGGKTAYDEIYYEMFPDLEEQVGIISEHNAPFDLEMILAQDPDIIIINSAMQAHTYALEIEDELNEAGIPFVLIDVPGSSIDELDTSVQDTFELLGQIFQEEEKAADVSAFIDEQFSVIQDADLQNIEEQPTVYYEKGGTLEDFGTTNSSMSGWGMVIAYAGGDNIADDALSEDQMKGMGATLDPEYILEADPDYVVLSGSNDLGLTTDETILETADFSIIDREGWDNITAVENGDVYEVMHELSRTPISFYAVQELAKVFYPETFEDLDPDANLAEYFENYTLLGDDSSIWFMQISE